MLPIHVDFIHSNNIVIIKHIMLDIAEDFGMHFACLC